MQKDASESWHTHHTRESLAALFQSDQAANVSAEQATFPALRDTVRASKLWQFKQ